LLSGSTPIAIKLFSSACEQGHVDAQFILGLMYGQGQGCVQDYIRAHMWLNIAASQGYEDARKNRNYAETLMSSEQIGEAQKLASEWMR
jgi:uncharacterized protein